MSEKVKAPIVGGEVDPSDPTGSLTSIVLAIGGLLLGGIIVSAAAYAWNELASRTPDAIPEVEIA